MRRSNLILTLVMLAFGPCVLQAAAADPQGVFDTQIAGIGVIDVDPFNISVDEMGGGAFNFRNASGNDWIGLDWIVTLPQDESFTLSGGPFFGSHNVTTSPSPTPGFEVYDISFDQPINGGIPAGTVFSINLNDPLDTGAPNLDPNGSGGWGSNNTIRAIQTNAVPEPTTWVLLAGGMAVLVSVRRLRLRAKQQL